MHIGFSPADEAFRDEVCAWMKANLVGEFTVLHGRGGPGDEMEDMLPLREAWERKLADGGWTCTSWPTEHGGRGLSIPQQLIWHEEYARAGGPGRLGHIGETLLGPTLIELGTDEQKRRFLPPIRRAEVLWCQGYSEPEAGSDLAGVRTRAVLDGDTWRIDGQKVWTSHAAWAQWCFVLCRTDADAAKHRGLSYILVPMDQPGITIKPIDQMTGKSEFCEVFFEGATTARDNIVGRPGDGWKAAMATLKHERGVSTLGQQIGFERELEAVIAAARANGRIDNPAIADRIAKAWAGLRSQRLLALRTLRESGKPARGAIVNKLLWSEWHKSLGELAMDVIGEQSARLESGELSILQRLFLFSRADTIYAGTSEIQRNIIAQRGLGLPRRR